MQETPIISIVDDDESVRAATESLVRSLGFVARTFDSAEAFLGSSALNDTDCLIVDVQMPKMSGLELQRALRSKGYGTPVIFVTAFPEERYHVQATKDGAIGFLSKPYDCQTLIRLLTTALGR